MTSPTTPTVIILGDASHPTHQLQAFWPVPFTEALRRLHEAIVAHDLLELGSINTTEILHGANLAIPQIRQVLAFHPRFMRTILETDPAAIVEAPLKFTAIERPGATELRCADPARSYAPYPALVGMGETLQAIAVTVLRAGVDTS